MIKMFSARSAPGVSPEVSFGVYRLAYPPLSSYQSGCIHQQIIDIMSLPMDSRPTPSFPTPPSWPELLAVRPRPVSLHTPVPYSFRAIPASMGWRFIPPLVAMAQACRILPDRFLHHVHVVRSFIFTSGRELCESAAGTQLLASWRWCAQWQPGPSG